VVFLGYEIWSFLGIKYHIFTTKRWHVTETWWLIDGWLYMRQGDLKIKEGF
jgi:hypothetical protein